MPNWCENALLVEGRAIDVRLFSEKFHGLPTKWLEDNDPKHEHYYNTESFYFHTLHPVPDEIIKKGFHEAGYEWCVQNWGTKWDIPPDSISASFDFDELKEMHDEETVVQSYGFDTARTPPRTFIRKVAKDFPELKFSLEYCESGEWFAGMVTAQGESYNDEDYNDEKTLKTMSDHGLYIDDDEEGENPDNFELKTHYVGLLNEEEDQ